MARIEYTGTVTKLLEIGQPDNLIDPNKWPDYPKENGLVQSDIPELIRMALDEDLYSIEYNEKKPEPALWAPIHALRALGQLKATQAIEPLLIMFDADDDYISETIPFVYSLIGPAAIPALKGLLQKYPKDEYSFEAIEVIEALGEIGKSHPDGRDEVIGSLLPILEDFASNETSINGFLVSNLTDLKAEQALPFIKEAFEAKEVDETILRWHTVQLAFGLVTQEEHDRIEAEFVAAYRARFNSSNRSHLDSGPTFTGQNITQSGKKLKDKAKAKRKISKASQKKNRKKK